MSSASQLSDYHDALTELPNRRLFDDRLKQALSIAERRQSGLALMLVSLAGFTTVPDHTVREAARRLGAGLCLVRNADAARARARELGRRHYRIYAR